METRASINQIIHRNEIGRENLKRGIDQKVITFGSAVKRKRLMDVTNAVGSSRMAVSKEASCGITKECNAQLKEENAKLLMAIAERNKIIELSSVEMQKLRFTVEKSYQQNRMLAQANSQMLAELTSMKERLKTMQHELGCTVAVLRMKNLALDEKEKLNKELSEKIRIGVEHTNNAEDATIIRPTQLVSNNTNPQSDEKELYNDFCENARDEEHSISAEVAMGASISYSDTNSLASNTNRRCTLRKKSSTTLNQQTAKKTDNEPEKVIAEERLKKESSEKKKDAKEELSNCAEVGTDTSKCHIVDSDMACETNRRRTLRSHSLGAAATTTHKMETKEKDTATKKVIRRSSRSSNNNLTSQEQETKEEDPVQAKASITVDPQVEAEEKDDTRTRKSSRRKSNNRESEEYQSKDHFTCSPVAEPSNNENPEQKNPSARSNSDTSLKHEKSKNQTTTSQCEEGQEVRRTSMRPTRRAVEKVSSYKEIPLKVKMRRVE